MLQCLVISLLVLSVLKPVELQKNDVSETIQNISTLLGSLINKPLRELQSLSEELSSLNDSVRSLHEQFTEHNEHRVTTDTNIQEMNAKLNTLISKISLHQQQTAAESEQVQILFTQLNQYVMNNLTHKLEIAQNYIEQQPVYTCGDTGGWRRVVYLDMTDPSTTCPSGWNETGYSKRTCGRATDERFTCDSATFPVSGGEYSRVCGRIRAYQWGSTDAFWSYDHGYQTIDVAYVDGIIVTHSNPRQHIWTFASGLAEGDPSYRPNALCSCDTDRTTPIPPFVGNDYFCESGVNERWDSSKDRTLHSNDPLWDGQNCLSSSRCCSLHNPPYFVKRLPTSTTDDIEARICLSGHPWDEHIAVELIELYVQ